MKKGGGRILVVQGRTRGKQLGEGGDGQDRSQEKHIIDITKNTRIKKGRGRSQTKELFRVTKENESEKVGHWKIVSLVKSSAKIGRTKMAQGVENSRLNLGSQGVDPEGGETQRDRLRLDDRGFLRKENVPNRVRRAD